MSGRSLHAQAILGQELYNRLSQTRVLLVGAGGIGCELCAYFFVCEGIAQNSVYAPAYDYTTVKNIVLTGFGDITLLDLDTIDLSNLNRQFLFRKKDIKQSKAMVGFHSRSPHKCRKMAYPQSRDDSNTLSR